MSNYFRILLVGLSLLLVACNKENVATNGPVLVPNIDTAQGIWSIKTYMDDQWNLYQDQPLVLLKTVEYDDKIDSSYVELNEAGFGEIRAYFDKSEINSPNYLNLYHVTEISDFKNAFIFLTYQALNDDLLTQKMEVSFHDETFRVVSVYIETSKNGFFSSEYYKLHYNSNKTIVIQHTSKSLFGNPKRKVIKYFFAY